MWQYPNMLPKLYTWGPVVQKLIEGAGNEEKKLPNEKCLIPSFFFLTDLMIPGLVLGSEGVLPTLKAGDLVAITIKGYK